jgi:hypothetical protein
MCGRLTEPPRATVTAARRCPTCERDTHGVPTPNGLITEAGDRVVFGPGAVQLSLDRGAGAGTFTRPGIAWFLKLLHFEGFPTESAGTEARLTSFVEAGLKVLYESPLLQDLDLENPEDVKEAHSRMEENADSPERWALVFATNARDAVIAIQGGNAREAAFSTMHAVMARAMWLYADSLEEIVWEGYLATGFGKLRTLVATFAANRESDDEQYWQGLLLENPFLLAQAFATPMVIHQGQAYVGGKEIDNRHGQVSDFLLRNKQSRSVALVEIKTPVAPLLGRSTGRASIRPPRSSLAPSINSVRSAISY